MEKNRKTNNLWDFHFSMMTSMLWDVKGVPVQDKEVTSVLQYFSGAVLMVAALMFDEPCPAMVSAVGVSFLGSLSLPF